MAKIDIVVPCYNYGRYLRACVCSILKQSVQDVRVLIIDDASADETLAVAHELAEADPRVAIISHKQNRGHIDTYNEGIAWASSDYFMLLSADDLLMPGALARATAVLDANPDVVLTYGDFIESGECLVPPNLEEEQEYTWDRQEGTDLIAEYCSSGCNSISTPTVIVRTASQQAIGGYRPWLPHSGDMEMWLRFAARGAVVCIHAVQGIKRVHATNMATAYYAEMWPDWQQRMEAFDSFFKESAECLTDPEILQAQAHRALAESAFYSSIAQLFRGNLKAARGLIRFAIGLRPSLLYWYWPPIARLARTPEAHKHIARVVLAGAKNSFRRTEQKRPPSSA